MGGSVAVRDRRPGPTPMVRLGILLAAGVALAGAAWWAGSLGPWTDRPETGAARALPRDLSTLDLSTLDLPTLAPVKPVDPPAATPAGGSFNNSTVVLLIVGAILLLAVLVIAAYLIRHRVRLASGEKSAAPPDDEVQAAPVVADPNRSFDPKPAAEYVISCWHQVEQRALGCGAGRRPEQTPTEFIQALKSIYPLEERAAVELLALYQRARFDHVRLLPDTAVRARASADKLLSALVVVRQGHP